MERLLTPDEDLRRKVTHSTLVTRIFVIVAILVGMAALVVSLTVAANTNRIVSGIEEQQDSNTVVVDGLQEIAQQIQSCTTPEGECTKRGQANQLKAVQNINLYGLFVVSCADAPGQQTEAELRQCADAKMKTTKR